MFFYLSPLSFGPPPISFSINLLFLSLPAHISFSINLLFLSLVNSHFSFRFILLAPLSMFFYLSPLSFGPPPISFSINLLFLSLVNILTFLFTSFSLPLSLFNTLTFLFNSFSLPLSLCSFTSLPFFSPPPISFSINLLFLSLLTLSLFFSLHSPCPSLYVLLPLSLSFSPPPISFSINLLFLSLVNTLTFLFTSFSLPLSLCSFISPPSFSHPLFLSPLTSFNTHHSFHFILLAPLSMFFYLSPFTLARPLFLSPLTSCFSLYPPPISFSINLLFLSLLTLSLFFSLHSPCPSLYVLLPLSPSFSPPPISFSINLMFLSLLTLSLFFSLHPFGHSLYVLLPLSLSFRPSLFLSPLTSCFSLYPPPISFSINLLFLSLVNTLTFFSLHSPCPSLYILLPLSPSFTLSPPLFFFLH
ncbi:unnamed protein product [Acanthosepion pharaonis]|uniref:Uncharacterized protein n=1 Tax=Acanthosepion pharaonis TaxID=158019 RepID=A0A812ASY8_ACAPH|nr:unnamed protein product [Sepia pharaonis]